VRKEGKYKLHALSDIIEDEMYCMKIVCNHKKIACGTSEGPIVLFNWDWYGDFKDRILGHPGSVNCMEKYDENTLVTGCEDGGIRFVSISPKAISMMISDKKKINLENSGFKDINTLSISSNKQHLAVCSNINYVKLYDISDLHPSVVKEDNDSDEIHSESEKDNVDNVPHEGESDIEGTSSEQAEVNNIDVGNKPENDSDKEEEKVSGNDEIENEGINEDEEDNESFSDSSSDKKKKKKNQNTLKLKALGKKRTSDWMIEKERRKQFFSDI
jgi:hypothetical protein